MTPPAQVRSQLIDALRLDLVGPRHDLPEHEPYAEEQLPTAPSKWYLTGFLVPYEAKPHERSDDTADEQLDQVSRVSPGDDEQEPELPSARKAFLPSSMGLSVLISGSTAQLAAKVEWGDYRPLKGDAHDLPRRQDDEGNVWGRWARVPCEAEVLVDLREDTDRPIEVPGSGGLSLAVSVRRVRSGGLLPEGTRSVSVFLVNDRPPAPDVRRDAAFAFQAELSLSCEQPFVPRPNLRGYDSDDWDEKVADLQYRDVFEFAVGHNVSAVAVKDEDSRSCHRVHTAWMPTTDVEKVIPTKLPEVELGMEALAEAESIEAVQVMVGPMVVAYKGWIEEQQRSFPGDPARERVAEALACNAHTARRRIQAGIDCLSEPLALEAFRMANRAIARAIRQRICHDKPDLKPDELNPPAWYPFQLAFLLMNLPGMVDPEQADRRTVDLLFFPTGGGKTEAYLGLAAFTMVLRRLRDPSIQSAGLSVIMRYTLRLLTLDQLGRAATLTCALELERQKDIEKLGRWPFEIGLWVGQTATPNRMGKKGERDTYSARQRTIAFQNDPKRRPSPIPLENCPWCGSKYKPKSFYLLPDADNPRDLRVFCTYRGCDFHSRKQQGGLPILAVDEPIYRRLPAFIIATVDKFANLPWVGQTAGLFGRVDRHDGDGFYGPSSPGRGRALEGHLPPPDLIIQDELHLISGPLGTMVGLYETAIDALSSSVPGADGLRPKIVASTATVRRAEKQIRGLFGRKVVDIFPPPGPNRRDSFFARTVGTDAKNGRTYVGIAAQGRNAKVMLLRAYLTLLATAQQQWKLAGGARNKSNPADPYMTLMGYFNSLRELGGSRRIVEDEVRARLVDYGQQRRRVGDDPGLFANRSKLNEPRELTSRVQTHEVADTKRRLTLSHHDKEHIDVALATNMISVGLDITRLGLMVVLNQPKTASEYIQATSRVGRDDERPGLVVTLLNIHRPRDRSHYERFVAWHESFYRAVEATSVTPFSPRAIDRGIAGVTVALARLGHPGMTAPLQAGAITQHRTKLDFVAEVISRRAEAHDKDLNAQEADALRQKVRQRTVELLDTWEYIASHTVALQYQLEVGNAQRLLYSPLDPDLAKRPKPARKFQAGRSLRDVEPTVNLWVRTPDGFDEDEVGS